MVNKTYILFFGILITTVDIFAGFTRGTLVQQGEIWTPIENIAVGQMISGFSSYCSDQSSLDAGTLQVTGVGIYPVNMVYQIDLISAGIITVDADQLFMAQECEGGFSISRLISTGSLDYGYRLAYIDTRNGISGFSPIQEVNPVMISNKSCNQFVYFIEVEDGKQLSNYYVSDRMAGTNRDQIFIVNAQHCYQPIPSVILSRIPGVCGAELIQTKEKGLGRNKINRLREYYKSNNNNNN